MTTKKEGYETTRAAFSTKPRSAASSRPTPSSSKSAPSLITLSHFRFIQLFSFLLQLTPFRAPELSTNSTMGPGVQFNGAAPGPPSFFNPLFDEAREPPSESVGKESKRLRFQTFAQSEYAEFDET